MTQPLGGPLQIMNRSQTFGQLEFDFDCDCALIFFPLEVRKYFSGMHGSETLNYKKTLNFKRFSILKGLKF